MLLICLAPVNVLAETRILLYGDSLMAGYGLPKEQHLSVVLQKFRVGRTQYKNC